MKNFIIILMSGFLVGGFTAGAMLAYAAWRLRKKPQAPAFDRRKFRTSLWDGERKHIIF